ncbi:MAG: hypothetical protein FD189_91 [Elusimicrobia bacterium]|nr:MAG: hypothetical protein FD154_243 [Elusimicrobiota bacterium]KAF0158449.1 MAG: hypothetical protein FD189_91 [Elusimicrobiota bacterium]
MDPISQLEGRTTFIVGSRKNAGKTTFLNYVLARRRRPAACLSVGVESGTADRVFGTPKPRVRLRPGDAAVVPASSLASSDAALEILQVYPAATAIGRPALARARREGTAEITGPATNSGLGGMLRDIAEAGIDTVLVDGAVDRITQAAARAEAGIVYVTRVEPGTLASAADAASLLAEAAECAAAPGWADFFCGGSAPAISGDHAVRGALTPSRAAEVPRDARRLVLEDLTKVFIGWREWSALRRRLKIVFARRLRLKAIAANLYNVTPRELEARLTPAARAKLVYNPYLTK